MFGYLYLVCMCCPQFVGGKLKTWVCANVCVFFYLCFHKVGSFWISGLKKETTDFLLEWDLNVAAVKFHVNIRDVMPAVGTSCSVECRLTKVIFSLSLAEFICFRDVKIEWLFWLEEEDDGILGCPGQSWSSPTSLRQMQSQASCDVRSSDGLHKKELLSKHRLVSTKSTGHYHLSVFLWNVL